MKILSDQFGLEIWLIEQAGWVEMHSCKSLADELNKGIFVQQRTSEELAVSFSGTLSCFSLILLAKKKW